LRKVFEIDPSAPRHFLTIRDAGYRFVAKPEEE
jgi:two-component system OmpR family response regulator